MPRLSRKVGILAKLEETYGTPPTFDNSTDAILVSDARLTFPSSRVTRDTLRPTIGALTDVVANVHCVLEFTCELRGSGMSGDDVAEPRIGRLFEACNYTKTAVDSGSGTPITAYKYTPNSGLVGDDAKSIAFEVYFAAAGTDVHKYVICGACGTYSMDLAVGDFMKVTFTFTGKLHSDPTVVNMPSLTYDTTLPLVFQNATFNFDGETGFCITHVTIDGGNTVALRKCASEADGLKGTMITSREITGTIDPEAVLLNDYNFWQKFKNGTTAQMVIGPVGSDSGNKITITAPKVQLTDYVYGDRDGIATYELPVKLTEDSGNDEIEIKFE